MRLALLVTALVGMVASPALAAGSPTQMGSASPAAKLSINARQGAIVGRSNSLGGEGNGSWVIGAAALVAGVVYAFIQKADDDDEPASP